MFLLTMAAASAELDGLSQSVAQCNRAALNPVFSAEPDRRSQFMIDAYREQEQIVADRLALSDQRRLLREAATPTPAAEKKKLDLTDAAIDDRQRALNDKRLLESMRQDTIDALRRTYLSHCLAEEERRK
ncbi:MULTISPECIES: hypothetical protein [Sphingomonas]|uniref:hypothetical protein n=1 Tax=Sphingomonas TaxID=13687 RepID=UPI000DEFA283|nr:MULTISPECIES: hypothetical protein [Sphingomonas]